MTMTRAPNSIPVQRFPQVDAETDESHGSAAAPVITVCVVTYRSADTVEGCLGALRLAARRHPLELIVVDNASDDHTLEVVTTSWPEARVIRNTDNVGFACANNQAIACARGRYVVLLNPDTLPAPGSLDTLVDHLSAHPDVGVAAPHLVNPDGTDQGTARAFPTPAAALFGRRSPLTRWFPDNRFSRGYLTGRQRDGDEPFDVDWVSGACLVIPASVVVEVGALDPGYFMYWEDTDWCRRIKAHGWRVTCVPAAEVIHHEGAARAGWPARRVARFHRSAYRYYARHHLGGPLAVLRPLAAIALLLRALAILLLSRRGASRGAVMTAATAPSASISERAVVVSTASQLAAKVLHFSVNIISSVAIVRYLDPAGFGGYVLVMTVAMVLGLVANLGLDKLAVREAVRRPELEDAVVGTTAVMRLALAVAAALLLQASLMAFDSQPTLHAAGLVVSLLFVGEALLTVVVTFHVRVQQQWEAAARISGEVVETAIVLWLVTHDGTLLDLVTAPVIGVGVAVLLAATVARRRFGLRPRVDRRLFRPLLRKALSIGPALLIGVLFLRMDSLMVAALRPRADLGFYGAAFQPIEYLLLACAVLINVLFPVLVAIRSTDPRAFIDRFRSGTEMLLGCLVIVPVVTTVAGTEIVQLIYGEDFLPSARPLVILAWALLPLSAAAWMSFVLLAANGERITLRLNVLALVVSTAGNLLLIPRFGIGGAASATLLTAVLLVTLQALAVRRTTGASIDGLRCARIALAASVALGAALSLRAFGVPSILAAAVGVMSYPVWLVALGVLDPVRLIGEARALPGARTHEDAA